MLRPIDIRSDYLEFECDECKDPFHHAVKISHDAPTHTEAEKYDVRKWSIMRIHLQCPKCKSEDSFKLVIREDLAKK